MFLTASCCKTTSIPSSSPNNILFSGDCCNKIDNISLAYNLFTSNGILAFSRFNNQFNKPCLAISSTFSGTNSIRFSKMPKRNNSLINFLQNK